MANYSFRLALLSLYHGTNRAKLIAGDPTFCSILFHPTDCKVDEIPLWHELATGKTNLAAADDIPRF